MFQGLESEAWALLKQLLVAGKGNTFINFTVAFSHPPSTVTLCTLEVLHIQEMHLQKNPPTLAFAKAGAVPGTTGGVEPALSSLLQGCSLPFPGRQRSSIAACPLPAQAFSC